ncbi:glycerol-3-phosphate 1-O-acyltransferase PlsY [Candidatus Kapabacteria bacterium]|nr:glycerol-3-phosphate 1-O-acyltransferase PlsY [Candidatus Kapabacteria bacterium]
MNLFLLILTSFTVGAIPFGVMISKIFFGFDIRSKGSGNMGSTNIYRVLGIPWGIVVQVLDILKGFVPTVLIAAFFLDYESSLNYSQMKIVSGLSAVLGHIFSPFVKFKGGKGINTAVGMLLGVSPIDLGVCIFFFLISIFSTGMISVGALVAAFILPNSLVIRHYLISNQDGFRSLLAFFIFLTIIVFFTHRSNIRRLIDGKENKFPKLQIFKISK